ncbi:MAG: methylenetetrahydrofolate--tRNA-(uracil(54)-C(5))-methyltransferase (FADH(2)-oxidizing) TrmFO [Candidatus Krumholzibacteriia bacterium]
MPSFPLVNVVGGGLAGCEAALQLGRAGIRVRLFEMRPVRSSPAHRTAGLAELVCSNSLKSTDPGTASGLLKGELDLLGCRLLQAARLAAVPAGAALAVDPQAFSHQVESLLGSAAGVELVREPVEALPDPRPDRIWVICSGPLTTPELVARLGELTGRPALHFFDAIAPTVTLESLDLSVLYRAARYGKGDADYLNIPLDREGYLALHRDLIAGEKIPVKDFDRADLFEGCQPIEEIAASGELSMAFGPLRPVGLEDPRTGRRPHAVIQLRQENLAGTLYGMVGFQTRLKFPEQKRIFRALPGLERAEFVRYGQMHRNFFLDSPRCLERDFSLRGRPDVFVAGQITGVEGYVESIASGLVTALHVLARIRGKVLPPLPAASMLGSLLHGFLFDATSARFTPMNANFGLLPDLAERVKGKQERKAAKAARALTALGDWPGCGIL